MTNRAREDRITDVEIYYNRKSQIANRKSQIANRKSQLGGITWTSKTRLDRLETAILKLRDNIHTEEATKNALIMPMLQVLGYDVFNPLEIVPEFTCDIGAKKGEKIDYAIMRDGVPLILIECKHWKQNLDLHNAQLQRYFTVSKARFGILTNGIKYRMYSGLVSQNKMDDKPFFEFDVTEMKDNQVEELKKFHKSYFDLDSIVNTASDLKYTNEIMSIIKNEITNPSEWFVRSIAKLVYPSIVSAKVYEQFLHLTKRSFAQVISDIITERFKTAITKEEENANATNTDEVQNDSKESQIVTTAEELEGFYVVKAALRGSVEVDRIFYRDTVSYFGILLDNNNRKPVCRLHFNSTRKFISIFDENRKEVRYEINSMDDIFKYVGMMKRCIEQYDNPSKPSVESVPAVSSIDSLPE